MKVTVVYGQKHKGNTYAFTQMFLDKLENADITELYANDFPQCVGCFSCIVNSEDNCPHRENLKPYIDAIDSSDVIVFSTPNYCYGMTGQMKSLCDHMAYRWMIHRPVDMRKKIGVAISTTAGAGAGAAVKQICTQFKWWSVGKYYKLPFAVWAQGFENIAPKRKKKLVNKVSHLAAKINCRTKNPHSTLFMKCFFAIMLKMHLKGTWNKTEDEYWKKYL